MRVIVGLRPSASLTRVNSAASRSPRRAILTKSLRIGSAFAP